MRETPKRRPKVFQRLITKRFIHEREPLLPLTDPKLTLDTHEPPSTSLDTIDHSNSACDYYFYDQTMSSHGVSPGSKPSKRGSILGASKKVVSSAVRLPLKAMGRAVGRRDVSRSRRGPDDDDGDDGTEVVMVQDGFGQEVILDSNGYGSINGTEDPAILNASHSLRSISHESNIDWPVHSVEHTTRILVLLCGAFLLGTKHPQWAGAVTRVAEYAVTAWITCGAILLLAFLQRRYPAQVPGARQPMEGEEAVHTFADYGTTTTPRAFKMPPTPPLPPPIPLISDPLRDSSREEAIPSLTSVGRSASAEEPLETAVTSENPQSHPALNKLFVVDTSSVERIYCNTEKPTHFENEWFEMDTVIIIRTPDVDDPSAQKGQSCNNYWSEYMRGKQRRFEFQFQIKLKKVPKDKNVYFSCELDEPIKMGMIQRAFVGAAMAFMKSTNPTFHYSITGSKERTPDGKYERPHMAFTVEGSLDRLVITKPGETPPKLGTVIEEDAESIKKRKKEGVDWNLRDTYTMALWSSYVDFLDWRVINLPGIRPFGLSSVLGTQAFYLTMYMIDKNRDSDKHYQKDLDYVVNWELGNDVEAEKGPYAAKWAKVNQEGHVKTPSRSSSVGDRKLSNADSIEGLEPIASVEPIAEEFEDDDDAETAAELGEGIYMRSGDSVCLRGLLSMNEDETKASFVSNGGGFAVLQDQEVQVVIEKSSRNSKKNRLIKSGDTVLFKMITKHKKEKDARYLTIHRGWWLKWVTTIPSKNGYFVICHHDGNLENKDQIGAQTNDSYFTIGASFTLRHKRWSSYFVGVAGDPSPTYGGRMLGLYNPKKTEYIDEQYHSSDGETDEGDPEVKASKPTWMKPLILTVVEPQELLDVPISPRRKSELMPVQAEQVASAADTSSMLLEQRLTFCSDHAHADVPAWIEMMNRRDRVRQLIYVVRVAQRSRDEHKCDDEQDELEHADRDPDTFLRLRTGRELAQIMRVGQRVKNYVYPENSPRHRSRNGFDKASGLRSSTVATPRQSSTLDETDDTSPQPAGRRDANVLLALSPGQETSRAIQISAEQSFEAPLLTEENSDDEEFVDDLADCTEADESIVHDEMDDVEAVSDSEASEDAGEAEEAPREVRKKKRGMMRKSKDLIGKSVKATAGGVKMTAKLGVGGVKKTAKLGVKTTKLTGKAALATGKFSAKAVKGAGKAAVGTTKVAFRSGKKAVNAGKTAGRAVIAPVSRKSKKPPKFEPRTKHKDKDHISVSKTLKKMSKIETKNSQALVAGELCAPEQSRRTASRVLSRMSSLPINAPYWHECNAVLKSQVQHETDQDRWFLEGTSVELGVTPSARGKLIYGSLVARCLWESHWREEWSGVSDSCVCFYAPLSKSPSKEIAYIDITAVRPLDAGEISPLPGFPLLVMETAWLCHYVAFRDEIARDTFGEKIESAIEAHIKEVEESASLQEVDLRKARFWQGFQSLSESSLSSGNGKWARLSSKDKVKQRAILNGRRMIFDTFDVGEVDMTNGFAFVEDLLARALSFSLESLENDPESLIEFLDLTSQLRILPLDDIDPSSKSSLCLFANLYHCLLQQAMLLSVNGPLHKKSVTHFMRTACYEIGGDVFSLAELYCCVLRGKMSKPVNPKPPYIEAPKKSAPYRHYALDIKDPRLNFVLNTGDLACPRDIPILRNSTVEEQLNEAAAIFLQQELSIDPKKSVIILPKVCEVYKNDFGGDAASCLKFCMGGLDEGTAGTIRVMMMDHNNLVIRYQHTAEQYHTSLTLREEDIDESNRSVLQTPSEDNLQY